VSSTSSEPSFSAGERSPPPSRGYRKEQRAESFAQIRLTRSGLLAPVIALILTISAIAGVWLLLGQVSSSRATLGAAGAMLLLLAAFGYFYFRSVAAHQAVERLAGDKQALLGISRSEARPDALPRGPGELLLVIFDLDGFERANDIFGHPSRESTCRQVTDVLLQVITEQDASLDLHVERVSELAGTLAEALGQPEPETQRIRLAAKLHDIGKTANPAALLGKPSPLNGHGREFVNRHPVIGARIVSAAPALANIAPMIRSSHERIDGHGYPDGLTGENIPLGSRIIAVCDAYETMTADRLQQPGLSVDAALEELKRHAGTQFDARIVKVFSDIALYRSSPSEPDPNTLTTSTTLNPRHTSRSRRRPETRIDHSRRPS
jgi:HD-GYP domain-containing protein (c-di-GMP phosphodiesterase class II)